MHLASGACGRPAARSPIRCLARGYAPRLLSRVDVPATLEVSEHNSYYERPGYARADAPQVLEEGETREGEGSTRDETGGAGGAGQARRPPVRHRRRALRARRVGPHGPSDEDGLREANRRVSGRWSGVPRRLPRGTVPGRHPSPRGLARFPRAGGVRAGCVARGGEPPAQLVQVDGRDERRDLARQRARPPKGKAHRRRPGEGRPLQGREGLPERRQRHDRPKADRVPRTRDVGRRLRVPSRPRAPLGETRGDGARRRQGGSDLARRRVWGVRRAGRKILERLSEVRRGIRLGFLLFFLRLFLLFLAVDLHRIGAAGLRAEDWHRIVHLLRPFASLDAHAAVRAVLRVKVLLVAGEEHLAVTVGAMERAGLPHEPLREHGHLALAEVGGHRLRTKTRPDIKVPTPVAAAPGEAWGRVPDRPQHPRGTVASFDSDARPPSPDPPRRRRSDPPPRGRVERPGRLREPRGGGPRGAGPRRRD